jgi:tetratricopeptide (TPR) repeat protein
LLCAVAVSPGSPLAAVAQDPQPNLPPEVRATYEAKLAEARRAWEHTPDNADSIIWLGRRTAYLGGYRDAIEIFTDGIRKHPRDARMYRHRGHRYITIRELDRAIEDLERGLSIVRGKPDEVEPDGIPNDRGIPTSTLQSNLRYHLGLAHYLKGDFAEAAKVFASDVAAARQRNNPDMLVASSHWWYMALRRSGKDKEARAVLNPITRDLPVIENGSYHRLLLLYRGELPADSLLRPGPLRTVEDVTLGYGVGNWHLYNGRVDAAREVFRRIVSAPQWASFGYLAAEAELKRDSAPPRLPQVKVSAKTPCQVHPENALETADLWDAAQRTLEGTTRSDSGTPTLLVREWRRTLDFRFEVRSEHSDTSEVHTRHPFEKPAPANLERAGYIQRQGWSIVYYGPDPELLLSERFLRNHCFRRVAGEGAMAGLAGLAFAPLPGTRVADVTGVLWVDPERQELRTLEYTWLNPPAEASAPGIGGRADFARLLGTGWIVQRWNIRMARPEAGYTRGFDGYTDQGGEVLAVTVPR